MNKTTRGRSILAAVCLVLVCVITAGCAAGDRRSTHSFSAALDQTEGHPGETVSITVCVTNLADAFHYVGADTDHFTQATMSRYVDGGECRFLSVDTGTSTTDATKRVWRSGEKIEHQYFFAIPEDAQPGSYSLTFFVCGTEVVVNDAFTVIENK